MKYYLTKDPDTRVLRVFPIPPKTIKYLEIDLTEEAYQSYCNTAENWDSWQATLLMLSGIARAREVEGEHT